MKLIFLIFLTMVNAMAVEPQDKIELKEARENFNGLGGEQLAKMLSNLMAKNLPQQLDYLETMSSVSFIDNKTQFTIMLSIENYEHVNHKKFPSGDLNFKKILLQSMQKKSNNMFCSSPYAYAALEQGLIIDNLYILSDFTVYGTISTSINDCK